MQKDTLVIDIHQEESGIPNTTLRGEVVKFLADRLPDLAQELEQIANRPFDTAILPPTANEVWTSTMDGAEYVFVPGGSFTMGAGEDDGDRGDEGNHRWTSAHCGCG